MLRFILPALSLLIAAGCLNIPKQKSDTEKLINESQKLIDSLKIASKADSMTKAILRSAYTDTSGVSLAPLKVISVRLVEREYSSYKDIRLTWKNVGAKRIAAIRFEWQGTNSFGEPADMGSSSLTRGIGGGFTDQPLNAGKTGIGTWEIMSRDCKKATAWPYEIAFEDGTKWMLHN